MNGVTFAVEAFRVGVVVRSHPTTITLTPVIEVGKQYPDYFPCGCLRSVQKEPDSFKYFEFEMLDKRFFKWDRELKRRLAVPLAFEFWTMNLTHDAAGIVDHAYPWIHWLFPRVTWDKTGRGRWKGTSSTGNIVLPSDYPEGFGEMTEGGFWKTATQPPTR